jgi:hypothetical protein
VRDLNFRGHRACVYRLALSEGPRILAAVPAAGRRGTTADVNLIGYGLATGRCELESVTRSIRFPDDVGQTSLTWHGELAGAMTAFSVPLSDLPESVEPTEGAANSWVMRSAAITAAPTGAAVIGGD